MSVLRHKLHLILTVVVHLIQPPRYVYDTIYKYIQKLRQITFDVKSLFKASDNSKIVGGALHCL